MFLFSKAALAIAATHGLRVAPAAASPMDPSDPSTFYGPDEERGSFDLVMQPYPIPVAVTTYVDFVFNLPADLPDLFHVVKGEVVNSQPLHLHHFVITGCAERIDSADEGVPASAALTDNCNLALGGWAPGSDMFGNTDLDAGVLMGRAMGVAALRLNVHYTDGAYADAAAMTPTLATDGIRVHYTPAFRPYTGVHKALINVGFGPRELMVPPGEGRFYITRSCRVAPGCRDETRDLDVLAGIAQGLGQGGAAGGAGAVGGVTCAAVQSQCAAGGDVGRFVQLLCPATCGFCDAGQDGAANPLVPEAYRVTAVNYHAHLLGREMYTTLLHGEKGAGTAVARADDVMTATGTMTTTAMTATDLESRELWLYDFQETIPLGSAADSDTAGEAARQGAEVRPGDRLQVTCVYDASQRDEPTRFGLSTYEEMCITSTLVTFATPASLLGDGGAAAADAAGLDLFAELQLLTFACDAGEDGDVHAGTLAADEDARDIWRDHPIEKAEGCTFPVSEMGLGLLSTRNCPPVEGDGASFVCGDLELTADAGAGASCSGGTHDDRDANDGLTQVECVDGGGSYDPYTCGDIADYLQSDPEASLLDDDAMAYLVAEWWQPKCCKGTVAEEEDTKGGHLETEAEEEETKGGITETAAGEEDAKDGNSETAAGEGETKDSTLEENEPAAEGLVDVSSAAVVPGGRVLATLLAATAVVVW